MRSLLLMRHSKSNWDEPGRKDFDRTLNDRGRKDAPEMGKRLKREGIKPDLIISSPAVRALKTAKEVARETGYPEKNILQEFEIYEADIDNLIHVIRNINDEYHTVILIGHNPALTGLVGYLTNSFIDNIPTSGVAMLHFSLPTWKQVTRFSGKLSSFDFPKNQTA